MTTTKHVPLGDISIDGGTQARVEIDMATVGNYADAMTEGETLPPAIVFFDGVTNYLADGFHRFHANRKIGATTMACEVRTGTLLDARLFSYGANRAHGKPPTSDDKRKAVRGTLADAPEWSDAAIAKHVGVSKPFVAAIRSPAVKKRQDDARTASAARKLDTESVQESLVRGKSNPITQEPLSNPITPESESVVAVDPRDTQIAELTCELNEALADNTRIGEVFDADDKLAAAMAANAALAEEVKQLKALLKTANERVSGLVFEKSEMNTELQKLQRQVTRLKKAAEPA